MANTHNHLLSHQPPPAAGPAAFERAAPPLAAACPPIPLTLQWQRFRTAFLGGRPARQIFVANYRELRFRAHNSDARPGKRLVTVIIIGMAVLPGPGCGQSLVSPNGQRAVIAQSASFGPLLPRGFAAPATLALPFRLSIPAATAARGYRLNAISSFVFTPAAPPAGGKSITASDVGVGITGVSFAPNVGISIAPGLEYDPAAVRRSGGKTPYTGAAAGQATLADLLPGREILRAEKMPASTDRAGPIDLTLTVKLAVQPQYFTPGGFSGTVTVIVVEPPD